MYWNKERGKTPEKRGEKLSEGEYTTVGNGQLPRKTNAGQNGKDKFQKA
jgi:hypothetical protein